MASSKLQTLTDSEIVSYVIKHCLSEGYIQFYSDREKLWSIILKEGVLLSVVGYLREQFVHLFDKWMGKSDGYVHLQLEWVQGLSKIFTNEQDSVSKNLKTAVDISKIEDGNMHMLAILQAIGKHMFNFLHKCVASETTVDTETRPTGTSGQRNETNSPVSTKERGHVLVPQPDSGYRMLAGGVVGQMFKLYNRRRTEYREHLKVLSQMTVRPGDKKMTYIPVAQKCRDRGGLYLIKNEFLPIVRQTDGMIRKEFTHQHAKTSIKVSIANVPHVFYHNLPPPTLFYH